MGDTRSVSEEVRAKGRELAQRLKDDWAYRQRVEADPSGVLCEAGLPEEAHSDFMRETGVEAEVAGYQGCSITCGVTCFLTPS